MKSTATCGRAPRPAGTTPAAGCGYHAAGQHPHHAVYPHRPERLPVQAGDDHRQPLRPEGRSRDGGGLPPEGQDRRAAVNRYLWDDENGCFRDYDWRREQLALFSAASIVTLYVGLATHEQAERLADAVRARLLTPGIMATEYESGEQWDKPNGWAPLQWMAIQGFKRYGQDPLGDEIAWSWLQTVNHFYKQHHKLIEKYHIATGVPHEGGGGSIPCRMASAGPTAWCAG
jgi:hypothetical protein